MFSKLLSKVWPLIPAVAEKCQKAAEAIKDGQSIHVFRTGYIEKKNEPFKRHARSQSRGGRTSQ